LFDYLRFFVRYAKPVGFGAALTCASSFGQTFMVSQFVPFLLDELKLSNAAFGLLYSAATLLSAMLLMRIGGRVDVEPLDRYTDKATLILSAAALALAATFHPAMLFAALFGLRFAGQGLMSNISQTTMARRFGRSRGKALSLAALGHSAGELTIPAILAFGIPFAGWRAALAALALAAAAALLLLTRSLPVRDYGRAAPEDAFDDAGGSSGVPGSFKPFRDGVFWLLAAPGLVFTVAATGYFFYQMVMVRESGWDANWYARVFSAYAAARVAGVFGTGTLVDRFGARFLYPFHFVPVIVGCLVFGLSGGSAPLVFYMVSMGLTMGASSVMQSAVLAETYGPEIVGTVRSFFASAMIMGAAAGPASFGLLLDAGIPMREILFGISLLLAAAAAASFKTWRLPRRKA